MPHDPIDLLLGACLRRLREERGLSVAEFSGATGLTERQVAQYEAGEARLATSRLIHFSRFLGVSPAVFYEEIERLDAEGRLEAPSAPNAANETARQLLDELTGERDPSDTRGRRRG